MAKFLHQRNLTGRFAFWKTVIVVFLTFFLASPIGSTSTLSPPSIERRLVTVGFQPSLGRQIDMVVLHSAYNPHGGDHYSVPALLSLFRQERVSAHYLIDRSGQIYQLVREQDIAHHAGVSRWQGRTSINRFSLGIELLNHPSDRYTEAQYQALDVLLRDIASRHQIRFLVAHGEIAPERRSDPWNFDWSRFARFRGL